MLPRCIFIEPGTGVADCTTAQRSSSHSEWKVRSMMKAIVIAIALALPMLAFPQVKDTPDENPLPGDSLASATGEKMPVFSSLTNQGRMLKDSASLSVLSRFFPFGFYYKESRTQQRIDNFIAENIYVGFGLGPETGISLMLPKLGYYQFRERARLETYFGV
jgi:hypothetical protein